MRAVYQRAVQQACRRRGASLEIFWSLYPTRQSNTARRAVTVLASINTPAPIVTQPRSNASLTRPRVTRSLKWRKSSENALKWRCMLPPDLILHGGKIITLDGRSRLAQAISVRSGHIAAVGDDAALLKEAAPTTRLIDLEGRSVLPGFFDAHPHADREGLKARGGIPIAGLHSVADIIDVVKRAAQTTPAGEWIVLMPMGEPPHEYISRPEQLTDGRFPNRHDLDAVVPDHAVYIRAVWGWWSRRPFPSVANSLALSRAGVTRDTRAPHNVEIVDARGEPTGVFLESATVVPGFLWMAGDRYGLDQLGEEAIPIRRMLDGGVPVALSTDGVPYSMLWTAWEALARWDDDGQRQLGDSRLTREQALRMAAQSGHRLTWNEDRYGSLEVGKVADMVVLAEDPLSCDLHRLKDIRVDRTFLGGRQVFGPT